MNIDWTAVGAIFTALNSCCAPISIVLLVATLFYLGRQVREMRMATYATAYKAVVDILQNEDVRAARRYVFVNLANKPFETWSEKDKLEAEKVCHSYDAVGQMVRNGFLPKRYVVDSWGASLRQSWPLLSPLILASRQQYNSAEVWDDYEWLANAAKPYQKPLG